MPAAWIDQDGLFHAGDVPGVYIVRATSNEDPSAWAEAVVTVFERGGPAPFPTWFEARIVEYRGPTPGLVMLAGAGFEGDPGDGG